MTNEDRVKKYKPLVEEGGHLILHDIMEVNHKPHPYTIGTKHIQYASENHGGMLGVETCKAVRCAHPGCDVPYSAHVSDRVMMLKIARNITTKELQELLKPVVDAGMEEDGIDGFTFIENKPFEITHVKPEEEPRNV